MRKKKNDWSASNDTKIRINRFVGPSRSWPTTTLKHIFSISLCHSSKKQTSNLFLFSHSTYKLNPHSSSFSPSHYQIPPFFFFQFTFPARRRIHRRPFPNIPPPQLRRRSLAPSNGLLFRLCFFFNRIKSCFNSIPLHSLPVSCEYTSFRVFSISYSYFASERCEHS